MLGICDYRLGDFDRALAELVHGRRLGVTDYDSLGKESARSLALLLIRSGQFGPAAKELARLLNHSRDDAELVAACGLCGLQIKWLPNEIPDAERDLVQRIGRATAAALAWRSDEAKALFDEVLARYEAGRSLVDLSAPCKNSSSLRASAKSGRILNASA